MIVAFHKPYGVLSQFTSHRCSYRTLKEFHFPPHLYPIGRLDADSEGLLLLSDEPHWNAKLLRSDHRVEKTYWALVERKPSVAALARFQEGINIEGKLTLPASARLLDPQPTVPARIPPIRYRKNVQDYWIEIRVVEGRNRQVRRMTASIGHPTLRLIRVAIGNLRLDDCSPGAWWELKSREKSLLTAP